MLKKYLENIKQSLAVWCFGKQKKPKHMADFALIYTN